MIHTPLTPLLNPLFDDSLGIHGKLQAMPVGRGFQGNGLPLNIEYATRRIERFALQKMAKHTSRNDREKRKNDIRASGA